MTSNTPTFTKLFVPTIEAIKEAGGRASVPAIIKSMVRKGFEHGGQHGKTSRTELEYRAAWARSYLKMYGALENPVRGVWTLGPKASEVNKDAISNIVNVVARTSRKRSKNKKAIGKNIKSSVPLNTLRASNTDFSTIDQARTILSLMEKGFMTKPAANEALKKLAEGLI